MILKSFRIVGLNPFKHKSQEDARNKGGLFWFGFPAPAQKHSILDSFSVLFKFRCGPQEVRGSSPVNMLCGNTQRKEKSAKPSSGKLRKEAEMNQTRQSWAD
jgi:hypothetical protein